MVKKNILHNNNPRFWNKDGHRIPGTNTNFDVKQPKNYYININDKVVTAKLIVIAMRIHEYLYNGKSIEEIANELTSSKVYGEFITKFQISYNQRNNTKFNRYEIIEVIYKNYHNQTIAQTSKDSKKTDEKDGPEDPEN